MSLGEDGRCPRCGAHGGFYFPPYWMHDDDRQAALCPLGNNWTLGARGEVMPWTHNDGGPDA